MNGICRIVENVNGCVKLGSDYERITAFISGRPRTWKADHLDTDGGKLTVKVEVDLVNQAWDVKIRGHHLFAPVIFLNQKRTVCFQPYFKLFPA